MPGVYAQHFARATAVIEAIDAIQRLAIALGDPPNPDTVNHCHDFHDAMTMMQASAQRLQNEGIRVMTAYIGSGQTQTMYLAQPTDDPVLIMLEELGVPMVHIEVTDGRVPASVIVAAATASTTAVTAADRTTPDLMSSARRFLVWYLTHTHTHIYIRTRSLTLRHTSFTYFT